MVSGFWLLAMGLNGSNSWQLFQPITPRTKMMANGMPHQMTSASMLLSHLGSYLAFLFSALYFQAIKNVKAKVGKTTRSIRNVEMSNKLFCFAPINPFGLNMTMPS